MGTRSEARAKELSELAEGLSKRLSLWLAVGNAAGFAGCATKALDTQASGAVHLLLPACWFFAAGLIFGFLFNFAMMGVFRVRASAHRAEGEADYAEKRAEAGAVAHWAMAFMVAAAAAFLVGLLYPLVAFSFRFVG